MFVDLPAAWLFPINIGGILCAHLGFSWLATHLPDRVFEKYPQLFVTGAWEATCYEKLLHIRIWKDALPDAASWFGGFPKKQLRARNSAYLRTYRRETCRGEFSHWCQMAAIMCFIVWTPWPALLIILAYALLSNAPCIVSLRFARLRIAHLLTRTRTDLTSAA